MTLPSETIRVLDPGLGLVNVAADTPIITGTCAGGTAVANTLYSVSSLDTVRTLLGQGDLAEDVAKHLNERGGPVLAVKATGSVAAVSSAVTKTGSGTPTPTIAGTATGRFSGLVRVKAGGALGVGQFDYTLDNHQPNFVNPTFSAQRLIPAGGSFLFVGSGLTMTFPAGTYVVGDTFSFTTEPAHANASDLSAIADMIVNTQPTAAFVQWLASGVFTTATEGAAMAVALGSQLQRLFTAFKYSRGHCDFGSADTAANAIAARAAFSDRRVDPCYGLEIVASALTLEGYANRLGSASGSIAARAARVAASTDLARYAEGALTGTQYIYFNSNVDASADSAGLSTLRTWPGITVGFYIANGYLAAPTGSDFIFWQYGRLMDIGCKSIFGAMLPYIAEDLRTIPGGTLDPLEAAGINTAGSTAMRRDLLQPKNARGLPGLVSDIDFKVGLTNPIQQDQTLFSTAAIRPRGYSRFISQTIGFSLSAGQ